MRQQDYEMIISCIQHGAPALATQLIGALNTVVENSNELRELKRDLQKRQEEPPVKEGEGNE